MISVLILQLLNERSDGCAVDVATSAIKLKECDLMISRWLEWTRIHEQRALDGEILLDLETKLVETAGGFRRVEISCSSNGFAFATTNAEIDRLLPAIEHPDENARAKAELAARWQAWEEADATVGYSALYDRDSANSEVEMELAEAVLAMPATSLAGTTAKLHCLIEMENPDGCLTDAPWPQLQSILNDLVSISGSGVP